MDSESDKLIVYEGEVFDPIGTGITFTGPAAPFRQLAKREQELKHKWHMPTDPMAQAWALREFLRTGKHALVLQCERTRQENPDNPTSPIIVCNPGEGRAPCFNCTIAILTGRKKWE